MKLKLYYKYMTPFSSMPLVCIYNCFFLPVHIHGFNFIVTRARYLGFQ